MRESKRYLGLELSGAKNQKTALASIEYYPTEKKIFLLDTFDRVEAGDESLLALLEELRTPTTQIGVNIALELPPCVSCTRKTCPLPKSCTVPAVKWMRETTRKAAKSKPNGVRVLDFTPYTQRPSELWVRYHALPELPESHRFEIDETLGGNKAPLSARMSFLKRHLTDVTLLEAWPKLTIAFLALELKLDKRVIATYRHLEEGSHSRAKILEILSDRKGLFIYERDARKLSQSLAVFDAFICALTALLADTGQCVEAPRGFPNSTGWVYFPKVAEA